MKPSTQPVWIGWLATVIVTLAARYGFDLDETQALAVTVVVGTLAQALVHRYVTPTARPRAADGTPLIRAVTTYDPPPPSGPRPPGKPLE